MMLRPAESMCEHIPAFHPRVVVPKAAMRGSRLYCTPWFPYPEYDVRHFSAHRKSPCIHQLLDYDGTRFDAENMSIASIWGPKDRSDLTLNDRYGSV